MTNLDLARECGATSFTPPPLRAVRGVSFTFDQLDAFAARVLAEAGATAELAHGVQPVALDLAETLESNAALGLITEGNVEREVAAELRRQHARIAEIEGQRDELVDSVCGLENKAVKLETQLEAVGAGGVSALMSARVAVTTDRTTEIEVSRIIANAAILYSGGTAVSFEGVAREVLKAVGKRHGIG